MAMALRTALMDVHMIQIKYLSEFAVVELPILIPMAMEP
jgi:hypothetical protein